jgi:hypothetical protein
MNDSAEVPKTRTPPVDMIGTYILVEPTQKIDPKDGVSYAVPAGDYPVMAVFSEDGKQITASATIFSADDPKTGKRMDIHEFHRTIDIPDMVHRQRIRLEPAFAISMFTPAPRERKSTQDQTPERKLSIAR